MSLLEKCSNCERENVGGDRQTGVCHRCKYTGETREETEKPTRKSSKKDS